MRQLDHAPRFANADAFYAALIEAVEAVGDEAALAFLTRLAMTLANIVGDDETLQAAIAFARCEGVMGNPKPRQ
ncbi:MAG: DUF2783 domain-containing protein [Pseudomonadota bacterium]